MVATRAPRLQVNAPAATLQTPGGWLVGKPLTVKPAGSGMLTTPLLLSLAPRLAIAMLKLPVAPRSSVLGPLSATVRSGSRVACLHAPLGLVAASTKAAAMALDC